MILLKLEYLIFALCAYISVAFGTGHSDEMPVNVGGKVFCVKPAETYCLNVVNYPRKEIDLLLKGQMPVYNSDLAI